MMNTIDTNFEFPKNSLKIKDEPCNICHECALYELDVTDEDNVDNKMFCASCNICLECEEYESTPNNICNKCYCPKCGMDYDSLIECFDDVDLVMQNLYRKQHIDTCAGRPTPVLDLSVVMGAVSMETD